MIDLMLSQNDISANKQSRHQLEAALETGSARDILERPAHPCTEGLMASVPRLDSVAKAPLYAIEGQPPDLAAPPPGCPFAPRCAKRFGACATMRPESVSVGNDHQAACPLHGR